MAFHSSSVSRLKWDKDYSDSMVLKGLHTSDYAAWMFVRIYTTAKGQIKIAYCTPHHPALISETVHSDDLRSVVVDIMEQLWNVKEIRGLPIDWGCFKHFDIEPWEWQGLEE